MDNATAWACGAKSMLDSQTASLVSVPALQEVKAIAAKKRHFIINFNVVLSNSKYNSNRLLHGQQQNKLINSKCLETQNKYRN